MDKVNLAAKLALIDERWSPRIVASYNGNDVLVVKVEGEFVWHSHPDTDDLFLVLSGDARPRAPRPYGAARPGRALRRARGGRAPAGGARRGALDADRARRHAEHRRCRHRGGEALDMMRPGPRNLITDVPGLSVGNASDARLKSGATVVTADAPFVAAVDVRGGAPGTRETDLLAPGRLVEAVDAIVLSGGSVFGLDAASGVVDRLRALGRGFAAGQTRVPIVPAAILFDLANGGDKGWQRNPYPALGAAAFEAAAADFALGSVGAGTGGMTATLMGGLGSASLVTEDGATVGALAAVNAFGGGLPAGQPRVLGRHLRDRRRVRRPRSAGGADGALHAATDEAGAGRACRQHDACGRRDRRGPRQGRRAPARRSGARRSRPGDLSGAHALRRGPRLRALDRRPPGLRPDGGGRARPRRRLLPRPGDRARRPRGPPCARQPPALLVRVAGADRLPAILRISRGGGRPR